MALNQALSGINAAQDQLNVISNNIANAGTVGFKGSTAQFAEVYAVTGLNLSSVAVGSGAELTGVAQGFSQGDLETTNGSLDMALSGNGFFIVNNGTGNQYTRDGAFHEDANGDVVTADGSKLQVYPPNAAGGFNTSTLTNLQLNTAQSAATATSTITASSNLPAGASLPVDTPFSPTDVNSYNNASTLTVYDSQGGSHSATIYYVKTANNTWNANLYIDGNSAGTASMTFNSAGALVTPANGTLSFTPTQPTNGASFPATMTLNVSNTTQFGTAYAPGTINQNGYEAGVLENVEIGTDGTVTAVYSNNQTSQLGQIAVANFANLQGLQQVGNNRWLATQSSGTAVLGTASVGQFGNIEQGQLETSNTSDTTAQLVNMIQAQQDYEANSQMLGTVNSLSQTLFQAVSRGG
ncbi:flagellar hook protein FlgE [Dyella nitratireducens]|uniref:Flagellar hook protein FlgE n=1 Tax=Dyella nitratireducens TaxID=1849580 RepID=A0ABQ1FTG8_9GAMM|nr:flagellar hook protein FlgE [Dyella nitratireducens]GGA27776.1 flagellar hook protein FlgE [Dyella nitratireducens]GLQ43368.1 flagellar hook protein FlgE [Dyella nitratireducens]